MTNQIIYKIAPRSLWQLAEKEGVFAGAPVDMADGFIHFSTAEQVRETAAKHFAGQDDLLLLSVDTATIAENLKFEPSRGGSLFPHLYAPLPLAAVTKIENLPLDENGNHIFPELSA